MNKTKSETLPVRYFLEIYEPDREGDVLQSFAAGQPFLTVSVGDTIDTRTLGIEGYTERLKVTGVEHLIWEVETHVSHKVLIFTSKLPT